MGGRRPVLLVGLIGTVGWLAQADANSVSSYFDGKRYDFTFTCEELEATPAWPGTEAHPPLEPREALNIARGQLDTLVPNASEWRLGEISLRQACTPDQWYYVVSLSPPPPRPDGGITPIFDLVVLMNGRAIRPDVSPWPAP